MFKFIHAADLHLDSPLKGLEQYDGAPVEEIRGATRKALRNLVDLAIREEADFIVIAGDIYDGDWKDHNTGLFFIAQMSRLREAGVPVIMISGNHDAANRMTRTLSLPDNVELLSHTTAETASTGKLAEMGVAIHGRSFAKAAETDNLVHSYPAKQSGLFNIGLLHTSLEGAEGHATYAPCTLDDLRQKGYDYWALGHVHNRAIICEGPPIVFSGNPQGRHIRETGAKGCYLVSVDDTGASRLQFEPLDVFRWEHCIVNAHGAQTPDEVLARFSSELAKVTEQHPDFSLAVRVSVTGQSAAHDPLVADQVRWANEIRAQAVAASGGAVWVENVRFQTVPERNGDLQLPTDGPIGELLLYLRELASDGAQLQALANELADLRKKLPHELIQEENGVAGDDPAEWKRLLREVEPLLLARLTGAQP